MEKLTKFIDADPNRKYYEHCISNLTDRQKNELLDLVVRLDSAGAKYPLSWAFSEITEKFPQFGRFLVLKKLHEISKEVNESVAYAADFIEQFETEFADLENLIGKEKFEKFLISYSKGVVYRFVELLDNGNENYKKDCVDWQLVISEDFEPTKQVINCLHESFLKFDDELK
jgi:hypothetical protein